MIKPYNNYVVVKPRLDTHKTNTPGLKVDTSFNPHNHAPVVGEVMAVPDKLYFDDDDTMSMPWETEMEIKVGDEVTYHYLSAMTAEDKYTGRVFEMDGEKYYFIKYDRIYTAKRAYSISNNNRAWVDHIHCLNGFVLIEPILDAELMEYSKWLVVPDKKDVTIGVVRYMGSLVKNYGKMYKDWHQGDVNDVKIGDVVAMDQNCNIPLQYSFHANIEESKEFYRVQRRYLLGVLKRN